MRGTYEFLSQLPTFILHYFPILMTLCINICTQTLLIVCLFVCLFRKTAQGRLHVSPMEVNLTTLIRISWNHVTLSELTTPSWNARTVSRPTTCSPILTWTLQFTTNLLGMTNITPISHIPHISPHCHLNKRPKRRRASPTCTVTSITTWPTASQHLLTYGVLSIILTSGRADTMTCGSEDSGPSCWCTMLPDACHNSNALYWILNTMPVNLECSKKGEGVWTVMCE